VYSYEIWLNCNSNSSCDCYRDKGDAVSEEREEGGIVVITKSMYFCTLNVKR